MDTDKLDSPNLSRRDFLKEAGVVIGGTALVSLALSSACSTTATSTAAPPSTPGGTTASPTQEPTSITGTDTAPPVSSPPVSTPPASSVPTTSHTATGTSSIPASTTGTNTLTSGNLLAIPGCSTKVASDRLYSLDNIWVKSLGNNVVQLGVSDPFQYLADRVNTCAFSPVGTNLQTQQPFGSIEADKLSVDLISPVSGKIVQANSALSAIPGSINSDPYGSAWMVNVQLTKPSELDSLVSPAYYAYMQSDKSGTVPPKR